MSRSLLFDEEGSMLKRLQKLDTNEQRSLRAFISDDADRQCCASKENLGGEPAQTAGS